MKNAIKVLVTPWDKGFTCGIVMDSKAAMTTEQYELCSTIARGMIKMATSDPQTTFMYGLRGFADDKKDNKKDCKYFCRVVITRLKYAYWLFLFFMKKFKSKINRDD